VGPEERKNMTTDTETKTDIRPMDDRLLVEPDDAAATTKGGIILPDQAKEKPAQGQIRAVGPGKLLDDGTHLGMGLEVGETVIFSKYAGTDVKLDGVSMILLKRSDVLAVVN
jgi:chaperonin GroES